MSFQLDDPIAALASAPGPAVRGIVRISGTGLKSVLDQLFLPDDIETWQQARTASRHAGLFRILDGQSRLPAAMLYWPDRRSYTGQPAAELHTVGSPPLLDAALAELFAHGVRPARPGEFTLRAFLAGRLDLVQAEAVLGVIDAPDHKELEIALQQLAGGISGHIAQTRSTLLDLLADLEAGLDFVEEDIEFIDRDVLIQRVADSRDCLQRLLSQADQRIQTTGRRTIVLAGLPNAGKSTLFNAITGDGSALVSEVRGTTRDYLSADLDWNGLAVRLIDTAGWESELDELMQQAQHLRGRQIDQADLIVWCTAADLAPDEVEHDRQLFSALNERRPAVLAIETKVDRRERRDVLSGGLHPPLAGVRPQISAQTGFGLDDLAAAVGARLTTHSRGDRQLTGMTASRCRESLSSAIASLEQAREAADIGAGEELVAIEIRDALEHLGRILGSVYTDDILDRIFSKFCIGK